MTKGSLHLSAVAVLLCAALLLAIPLAAQTFYGSIVGTVTDPSRSVIPGASITLSNTGTGERRAATTGADGSYRFVNLLPGAYKLEVEAPGFQRYSRDQIEVNVESTVRADVGMQLGSVEQTVEVTSAAPLLQTETATVGQVVNTRAVENLPLNGRNVLNLASNVAGVVPQGGAQGSITNKNVFAGGNYQIGGGTANQSATYYDGVPVNDTYGNVVVLTPSPDAVSEFRVQTNSNSAEFGRFIGGVINMASRGGTNNFHGSLYEFYRGKQLNANDFFANRNGVDRPRFTQNQYGGSLGGPVLRDKLFFFVGYEAYRQRQGQFFSRSVPPLAFRSGDFSNFLNSSGNQIAIYDPLTQCGAYGNPACTAAQSAGTSPQRQQFPGNIIPADRISPIARRFVDFPIHAVPNGPGATFTQLQNYNVNRVVGGDNDQGNVRVDLNITDKQRLMGRYTHFDSRTLPVDIQDNGQYGFTAPENFVTKQIVLAHTYTLNPTTVLDARIGYLRWGYNRVPGNVGIDIPGTFGLPASTYGQLNAINKFPEGTAHDAVPRIGTQYNFESTGLIFAFDNTYVISPTLTKVLGRHTLKVGAELRRADINYFQDNNPGGTFDFSNLATSRNAQSPGGTGSAYASFLLGLPSGGVVQSSPFTAGSQRYQGYFVNDSWQVTPRLTMNLGLRWEIPGVYTERFDNLATFHPDLPNPLTQGIVNPVTGQPFVGAFALVNTAEHPERGLYTERFNILAPRVGLAYRITDSTVIRAGGGRYIVPATARFQQGPTQSPNNLLNNQMVTTQDDQVTFLNFSANTSPMDNPFPDGLRSAPGRDPSFQQILLGGTGQANLRSGPGVDKFPGETWQWNLSVQRQFAGDFSVDVAYAALAGMYLPVGLNANVLPLDLVNQAANDPTGLGNPSTSGPGLLGLVDNPLFGIVTTSGALAQPRVQRAQLMRPFPHYVSSSGGYYVGHSTFHSLQITPKKRLGRGGTIMAAYTFSKNLTNVETQTFWLEGGIGGGQSVAGYQTPTDLSREKALSSFDSRHRLVLNWAVDLPFGRGQRFGAGVQGFLGKMVSGWRVNNIATFQPGNPLGLTATPNLTGFGYGLRPNVVPGCDPKLSGPVQERLNGYFDKTCFTVPGRFQFGNEPRNNAGLRGPGLNNWDITIAKNTNITEQTALEFRAEFFNAFNRVRFAKPNQQISTNPNVQTGQITATGNDPRQVQLALRLTF